MYAMRAARRCAWMVMTVLALLAGCGGGGGGGGGDDDPRVTAVVPPAGLSAQGIEGLRTQASINISLDVRGIDTAYIGLVADSRFVVDGDIHAGGGSAAITVDLSTQLPPGVHDSELRLLVCRDENCERQISGSPIRIPLRFEVLPQIRIEVPQAMRRSGREPGPVQVLDAVLPPNAGFISLQLEDPGGAFDVRVEGQSVVVQARQVRAGSYRGVVRLTGNAHPAYRAQVELDYVVEAPPGGESPLAISPSRLDLYPVQGSRTTYRFRVDRPTWTDQLEVRLFDHHGGFGAVRDLRHVGGDEYEFTVDTTGLPQVPPGNMGLGAYYADLVANAGPTGGQVSLYVVVNVNAPLRLGNPSLSLEANALTSPSELRRITSVEVPDGAAVGWSAQSDQPWLRVVRASGITGVDDLVLDVDPAVLDRHGLQHTAQLSVSVDRPGTLPVVTTVGVRNLLPRFEMASPGALLAPRARVYLHGMTMPESRVLSAGVLSVVGANLVQARIETDGRFIGYVGVLTLELDGIVAGRDVVVRAGSLLRPAEVTLRAVAAAPVAAGYQALPRDSYRPPSFAPGRSMLVFAGSQGLWHWSAPGGVWGTASEVALPQLVDAAPAPDESVVYAWTAPATVAALDPVSWLTLRHGQSSGQSDTLDPSAPRSGAALRFAADGRAFVTLRQPDGMWPEGHGAGWLAGCSSTGALSDIAAQPCLADPGSDWLRDTAPSTVGATLARSASGSALAITYPVGATAAYRGIAAGRSEGSRVPAGVRIVAVDDTARWRLRDDGQIESTQTAQAVDLASRVPAGFVAGGYGVTGGGEFALVYAYRSVDEPSGPRARDARVLLFDLRGGTLPTNPTPATHVDLVDAVGCTVPLAAGETCRHAAHVVVAPGDRSVFVLGPRGVTAAALPDAAMVPLSVTRPARSSTLGGTKRLRLR